MNRPAQKANELLEQLAITSLPISPQDICSGLGITYREHPFDGFEGLLVVDSGSAMIGVNSNIASDGRKAYTAGHELGHLCLHVQDNSNGRFQCSSDDTSSVSKDVREVEANSFAAELMMPSALVRPIVGSESPSWDSVKTLADRCKTSMTAAAIRFVELTEFPCAMVLSTNGVVKFYRASSAFRFRLDMDSRMLAKDSHAYAANLGRPVPGDFNPLHPDRWLAGRFTSDSEILEWSLPKNRYGQVLTLLLDEGDVCFAKDRREQPRGSMRDDDDDDVPAADTYMREVNPFRKSRRR